MACRVLLAAALPVEKLQLMVNTCWVSVDVSLVGAHVTDPRESHANSVRNASAGLLRNAVSSSAVCPDVLAES